MKKEAIDDIGPWSEVKLDIIKDYASAYSTIFHSPRQSWATHIYVDAFSGPGVNISRRSGDLIAGSPLNALMIENPFKEYYLIDADGDKTKLLRSLVDEQLSTMSAPVPTVKIFSGDSNPILLDVIFPRVEANSRLRALCLLDPYKKRDLDWEVVRRAGSTKRIELFINVPMLDIERNVLRRDFTKVSKSEIEKMNRFWGDESWQSVFSNRKTLFGDLDRVKAESSNKLVKDYKKRLKNIAGFAFVTEPLVMRNSSGGIVYYLYFASPNRTGAKIVSDIFGRYRKPID